MERPFRIAALAAVLGIFAFAMHSTRSVAGPNEHTVADAKPTHDAEFKRVDADGSGSISHAEFDAQPDRPMSFADLDSDRDGVVSMMEWDNHGKNTRDKDE